MCFHFPIIWAPDVVLLKGPVSCPYEVGDIHEGSMEEPEMRNAMAANVALFHKKRRFSFSPAGLPEHTEPAARVYGLQMRKFRPEDDTEEECIR